MKDQYFELIAKYALLLTAFFILSFVFARTIIAIPLTDNVADTFQNRTTLPHIFNLLLNLITVFVIGRDIKKLNLKTKYVLLSTVVYRPLGVVAFLLFLFLQGKNKVSNN